MQDKNVARSTPVITTAYGRLCASRLMSHMHSSKKTVNHDANVTKLHLWHYYDT